MPRPLPAEKKLEWEEKILQQRESELSIERWCEQNQIAPHLQPNQRKNHQIWPAQLVLQFPLNKALN